MVSEAQFENDGNGVAVVAVKVEQSENDNTHNNCAHQAREHGDESSASQTAVQEESTTTIAAPTSPAPTTIRPNNNTDVSGSRPAPSDNALTVPGDGASTKLSSPSAAAAAAAAADSNAMPPPPPTTPGSTRPTTSTVSSISCTAGLKNSNSSVVKSIPGSTTAVGQSGATPSVAMAPVPTPLTATTASVAMAKPISASNNHVPTKVAMGTPSQLATTAAVAARAQALATTVARTQLLSAHASASTQKPLTVNAQHVQSTAVAAAPKTIAFAAPPNKIGVTASVTANAVPRPVPQSARTPTAQPVAVPPKMTQQVSMATSTMRTAVPKPTIPAHYSTVGRPGAPTPGAPMYMKTPIPTTSMGIPSYAKTAANMRAYPPTTLSSATNSKPPVSSIPSPSSNPLHHPHHPSPGVTHVSLAVGISPVPDNGSSNNSVGGGSSKKKTGHPLRRGKWTSEEEAYANRLINEFKAGLLPLTDGTTLRNFLSKLLNCDPMRISKKFVGNNCIGKQVFRRRAADINRLTAEQIQQNRVELSELERRFFDRVAQTNRVKPGVNTNIAVGNGVPATMIPNLINSNGAKNMMNEMDLDRPPTPPWLKPPANYKSSRRKVTEDMASMSKIVAMTSTAPIPSKALPPTTAHANNAARDDLKNTTQAIKGLLSVASPKPAKESAGAVLESKSHTEKVMEAMQKSESSLEHLARTASSEAIPRTESALEQLARTASAAKFVEDIVNGDGFGDSAVRGNKRSSFEALMSLDLHSVENLVELASHSNLSAMSSNEIAKLSAPNKSVDGMTSAPSSARMESFIKSLSSANLLKSGFASSHALGGLLQNIQNSLNDPSISCNSLFDAEKIMHRVESSTGFSELRALDGLANGNSNSVEDFLSLVASGDIPHQDENMLNVPLKEGMQQGGAGSAASKRAQQQLIALASRASLARLAESSSQLSEMASLYNSHCSSTALKNKRKLDESDIEQGREST